jgi:hypothetical protein
MCQYCPHAGLNLASSSILTFIHTPLQQVMIGQIVNTIISCMRHGFLQIRDRQWKFFLCHESVQLLGLVAHLRNLLLHQSHQQSRVQSLLYLHVKSHQLEPNSIDKFFNPSM